ncbi:MAG: hypothetical protein JNK15_07805 [Planctomycetes bacterium]|nr:hypothetical protein [Planctomycetota bacterium]
MHEAEAFVDRCRRAARALQHELRAAPSIARAAAMRFTQLPTLRDANPDDLIARNATLRARAQDVVAYEHGFLSWGELLRASVPLHRCVTMHCSGMGAFLNQWFTSHAEAAAALATGGGYLLPYRTQFFVTVAGAIRELGLDPDDPDWRRIGFDWVQPRDPEAHLRLCRARFDVMLARGDELP